MPELCERCSTPLDDERRCVTCDAEAEGLKLLIRSGYASVREMMTLLEEQKLAPEMEKVPSRRPEEKAHPLWNLYVPKVEAEQAVAFLRKDWSELLDDPEAAAAAQRGQDGIDLDAGGEVDCPACGHRFIIQAGSGAECPECGLSLGAPAEAAPDESQA
jgi:DNA-directed RNA polymerase subunit RPC12/RpoP